MSKIYIFSWCIHHIIILFMHKSMKVSKVKKKVKGWFQSAVDHFLLDLTVLYWKLETQVLTSFRYCKARVELAVKASNLPRSIPTCEPSLARNVIPRSLHLESFASFARSRWDLGSCPHRLMKPRTFYGRDGWCANCIDILYFGIVKKMFLADKTERRGRLRLVLV